MVFRSFDSLNQNAQYKKQKIKFDKTIANWAIELQTTAAKKKEEQTQFND